MDSQYSNFNREDYPGYADTEYAQHENSKQYTHLIANPGRVAQAREITQIQSTVKNIIKSVGDSFMKDGDVIEGCQVIVSSDKKSVKVTPGKVYINGMVLPVIAPEIDLTINPNGEIILPIDGKIDGVTGNIETIGFRLKETLVTEIADKKLLDPAIGFDNMNQAGCYRIKSEIIIVKDDENASTLATLIDGEISVEQYAPTYSLLQETLARRTNDESGSYIVNGLKVRTEANSDDKNYFNVVIEEGKAYINGYEIGIPAARRIPVRRSNVLTDRIDSVVISSGVAEYPLTINTPIIADITKIEGTIEVSQEMNPSKGGVVWRETTDVTPTRSVVSVIGIGGEELTGYTVNYSGGITLIWSGNEPDQYIVTYRRRTYFNKGVDYEFYTKLNNDQEVVQGVKWIGDEQNIPLGIVSGTSEQHDFFVEYKIYTARKDIVCIDMNGEISVIEGDSAISGNEVAPEAKADTLPLAYIMSPPNGGSDGSDYGSSSDTATKSAITSLLKIVTSNIGLTRFTMRDIQRILERVKKVEFDQSILSLNDEAKSAGSSKDMRGIFTDPLVDFSRVNPGFKGSLDGEEFEHSVVIDLENNMCYLPVDSNIVDAMIKLEESTVNKYKSNRTVSLGKIGTRVSLSQLQATTGFKVNPYTQFPQSPEISIAPAVDAWFDDTIIEIPEYVTQGEEVVETANKNLDIYNTQGSRRPSVSNSSYSDTKIGTRIDGKVTGDVIDTVLGDAIKYIRPRTITVTGSKFKPGLGNLKGYFDGVPVDLTVNGKGEQQGEGVIKADDTGSFIATFDIPTSPRIQTGVRELTIEADLSNLSEMELREYDGYITSASALYQAVGQYRTIYQSVSILTTVLLKRVTTTKTTHYIDPVGQTFVLNKMTLISGVNLYFKDKPKGVDTPVTCEIREVVNGSITSTSYGSSTHSASEVNIDETSANVAEFFEFDDPILLEANKEYAIVIRSTSPSYELWVAELGKTDVRTGAPVITNPYLIGVMMSSSNNSSWTMHQTMDIKFELIEDIYDESAEVLFEDISVEGEQFSRVYLSADSIIPSGTSVDWSYQVYSGDQISEEKPIYTNDMTLLGNMYDKITLKAKLSREKDASLSPILALDTVGTSLSKYENKGYYVTKMIQNLDDYTAVDVIVDTYTPGGVTSLEFYVSTGDSNVWHPLTLDPAENKSLGYSWYERTYRVVGLPESTNCRLLVRLATNQQHTTPAFRRLRLICHNETEGGI